jgi:hypothetical protein
MLRVFRGIQNLESVTLKVAGGRQESIVESGLLERHKHCLAGPRTAKNTRPRTPLGRVVGRSFGCKMCRLGDVFVVVQVLLGNVILGYFAGGDL